MDEFKLPSLGENIDSGDVVKVLVSVGDQIKTQQTVLELETDKAVIEVPSSLSGTVQEIHVKEGEKAEVGQLILTVENQAQETKEKQTVKESEREAPNKGEETTQDSTQDKEDEAESQEEEEGKTAEKEQDVDREGRTQAQISSEESQDLVPAAPSVRRFAREIGVDIHRVEGSGPGGRISVQDVKKHTRRVQETDEDSAMKSPAESITLPDFSQWGEIEHKSLTTVRRKTAERVGSSWLNVPHVTQHDKADITDLEQLRKRYANKVEAAGGKLTITAIVLKAVSAGLKVFPQFNASIDIAREQVIYKKYCHIGVAVDTDRGLLVPVIRDVDSKNIVQLSVELSEAAEKARKAKLTPEEMQGGSFTISNLGGIGGTYFSPIVNFPEAAILGLSRAAFEPVYREGEFEPCLLLPLSLSYDHRLVDGADAIRFLRWIAEALENPFLISLEG